MDFNGSVLSLGDLKVGDAIAVDGAYLSTAAGLETLGILRLQGVPESRIQLYPDKLADPMIYIAGRPIATDTSTAYIGLTRAQFFAGYTHWPHWSRFCPPSMSVLVRVNADGSLTALSITETWEADWCG
jgi:hypothetical protein